CSSCPFTCCSAAWPSRWTACGWSLREPARSGGGRAARRAAAGLACVMLVSGRSLAQPRGVVEGGLALAPVYDDDVFAAPGLRSPDDFWRLMPHLGLGLRTPRLTLDAGYEMAAETYRRHDALDDPLAAQDASLALGWSPTRRLTAETKLAYAEAR